MIWALLGWLLALAPPPELRAELERLEGHEVTVSADGASYTIDDVAGEGAPLLGEVQRRGDDLYLVTGDSSYRLTGPLAKPRIAGPGYRVWVLGEIDGEALRARRLGVLAPPQR